jgi:hypothetical protein
VGYEDPRCPDTAGLAVPGPVAEEPCGTFYAKSAVLRGFGNPAGSYSDDPAGYCQALAEVPHCQRVPPAFLNASEAVLHMEAAQAEALLLP